MKVRVKTLKAGDVGYFSASIKQVADARVGDTVTSVKQPATEALVRDLPSCVCEGHAMTLFLLMLYSLAMLRQHPWFSVDSFP